jgi:hypothetical protein
LIDPGTGGDWVRAQEGDQTVIGRDALDGSQLRFIRTPRDLANYVHFDKIYQEYLIAACILLAEVPRTGTLFATGLVPDLFGAGDPDDIRVLNPGNPYRWSAAQNGFATLGMTQITALLAEVATRAHKAVFFQKWFTARRLRPEEFGGRVHYDVQGAKPYPIHADLVGAPGGPHAPLLDLVERHNRAQGFSGSRLLPEAFSEGCPTHPSYAAAHATLAGAAVTVLKALFDGAYRLVDPDAAPKDYVPAFVANTAGDTLEAGSVPGPAGLVLDVDGELNKLASNIAFARSMAGVHWRSDNVQGLLLGERVALELLIEQTRPATYANVIVPSLRERHGDRSPFAGDPAFFRVRRFNGQTVDILDGRCFLVTNDTRTTTACSRAELAHGT